MAADNVENFSNQLYQQKDREAIDILSRVVAVAAVLYLWIIMGCHVAQRDVLRLLLVCLWPTRNSL